jgi:hypothetical protein
VEEMREGRARVDGGILAAVDYVQAATGMKLREALGRAEGEAARTDGVVAEAEAAVAKVEKKQRVVWVAVLSLFYYLFIPTSSQHCLSVNAETFTQDRCKRFPQKGYVCILTSPCARSFERLAKTEFP